jgi:hypothetical protein
MNTQQTTGGLSGALLTAQRAIGGVGKDASNTYQGYDYVSAEKMIKASRAALHGAGLVFYVLGVAMQGECVEVTYTLQHPDSGEGTELVRVFPVVPGKGRPADKAHAGALTACMSYTLRDLLLIPRVDPSEEMDAEGRDLHTGAAEIAQLRTAMGQAIKAGDWTIEQGRALIATTGHSSADALSDVQAASLHNTITTTTGPDWAAKQGTA